MRFFLRWNIVGLLLMWPVIGHAQLMDSGSEKPEGKGGDPAGAWMADSTALPVWASATLLGLVQDESIDGTVSGTVKLDTNSGAYETDYVTSVKVSLTIQMLGASIDSTFVDTFKQAGTFSVEDTSLILTPTVEEGETAVSDTLGFTARDDSLFLIQVVSLPPQYATIMASMRLEAPLAILGFAKAEGEPDPPTPPEPPPTGTSADFNGDGKVDFSDFLAFAGSFGSNRGDVRYEVRFDLDGDGSVAFSDFLIFAGAFGSEVPPSGGNLGACRAGLVVNPGATCTYKGQTFSVSSSGRGSIAFFSAGTGIDARGSTINGVRWNFHATKNSGSNAWTIHTAD